MGQEIAKEAAGEKAALCIKNNMIVGLGSGTTAHYFIKALSRRCQEGLKIKTVASSRESAELAKKGGLEVVDINFVSHIDITVDGADEIDRYKRMIKGGGGAHVREKILASSSGEMIVIVDETKVVDSIGKAKLPVEILFYGSPATRMKLENLGYKGTFRLHPDGSLFITENGNLLFDIAFASPPADPEKEHLQIIKVPGVVDTGFFFHLAGRVFIASFDGNVTQMASL